MDLKIQKAVLVYQAGIANVFAVDSFNMTNSKARNARRLLQYDFRTCENYARGLAAAGCEVISAGCNMAGDIADTVWSSTDLGPFRENARPINFKD